MGTPERFLGPVAGEQPTNEALDPHHFYAAYSFESAALRGRDVASLFAHAHHFECPIRYWWASEVTNLKGGFDRLIVCVHHISLVKAVEMHGLLRQAAVRHQVVWDEFDAAKLDECRTHGKCAILKEVSGIKQNG
jgi:hypothetical protein